MGGSAKTKLWPLVCSGMKLQGMRPNLGDPSAKLLLKGSARGISTEGDIAGVTESWNGLGQEGPLRSSSPKQMLEAKMEPAESVDGLRTGIEG